jgi:hypothetical protein
MDELHADFSFSKADHSIIARKISAKRGLASLGILRCTFFFR